MDFSDWWLRHLLWNCPDIHQTISRLSEDIGLIKCLSDIFCWVCKINHILSVIHYTIHYTICGAVWFQFTHSPCDDWDIYIYIYFVLLSYYHHQIRSMNYYPLFRVRSWNNGVRCMSFYILMNVTGLHWWSVNIGSGNGLVPWGNKPLPEPLLMQIFVAI